MTASFTMSEDNREISIEANGKAYGPVPAFDALPYRTVKALSKGDAQEILESVLDEHAPGFLDEAEFGEVRDFFAFWNATSRINSGE